MRMVVLAQFNLAAMEPGSANALLRLLHGFQGLQNIRGHVEWMADKLSNPFTKTAIEVDAGFDAWPAWQIQDRDLFLLPIHVETADQALAPGQGVIRMPGTKGEEVRKFDDVARFLYAAWLLGAIYRRFR